MDAITIPQPFIHANMKRLYLLTGLDRANDRFHASVSNAFLQNNDDPTSRYELLGSQYEKFEPSDKIDLKPNVGILRISWIDKYTQRRPAVVLLFVDLEWDDPNFNEKKTECESKIHSLKQTIKCQEVRYLLVLIQKRESNAHQAERASELCTACGLARTQLIPLYVNEGVKPHVITAIKKTVSDFSHQFYQAIHKKIRTRKLGYISELRNDLTFAMSSYKLAFEKYNEAKIADEDLFEYLTIASLINYKICEIYFGRGSALEAITQFNRHEDKFMNKSKFSAGRYPSEQLAEIEHAKWCMREYATFGDLFVEASRAVVLNTSINPGKYFHFAGEFSELANRLIEQLKNTIGPEHERIGPEILQPVKPLTFLGQRPWRPNVSLALATNEHYAKLALEKFTNVDLQQSINHISRSIYYFGRIERCSRQIRVAELQLANVLLKQKNFEEALRNAERVFQKMREVDGVRFYTPIYFLLYELYFVMCEPAKLLQVILQILCLDPIKSPSFRLMFESVEEAMSHLLICFNNICSQQAPPLLPTVLKMLTEEEREILVQRWQQAVLQPIRVDLTTLKTLFFARGYIHIDTETCSNEEDAECEVRIENKFIDCISFTAANFIFDIFSPSINSRNPVPFFTHSIGPFAVATDSFRSFSFPLKTIPPEFHGGCEVTFAMIELKIGDLVTFVFDNRHCNFDRFLNPVHQTTTQSIRVLRSDYPLEITQVEPQPILRGDIALRKFVFQNHGNFTFSNIKIKTKSMVGENRTSVVQFYNSELNESQSTHDIEIENNLLPNQTCEVAFYTRFDVIGEHGFEIEFSATLSSKESSTFVKKFPLLFNVQEPFTAKISVLNIEGNPVDHVFEGHRGSVQADMKAQADCFITRYEFRVENDKLDTSSESFNRKICADESFILSAVIPAKTFSSTSTMYLGNLLVFWKRDEESNEVSTIFDLGSTNIIKSPIAIRAELGNSDHIIHKAIQAQIVITNLLPTPLTVKLTVHRSDVFMFAGTNEVPISLEPRQTQIRAFSFVANLAGELPFPRITLECNNDLDTVINSYAIKTLPKSILVLPTSKTL